MRIIYWIRLCETAVDADGFGERALLVDVFVYELELSAICTNHLSCFFR